MRLSNLYSRKMQATRAPNGRFAKRRDARIAKKSMRVLACACLVLVMGVVFSRTFM